MEENETEVLHEVLPLPGEDKTPKAGERPLRAKDPKKQMLSYVFYTVIAVIVAIAAYYMFFQAEPVKDSDILNVELPSPTDPLLENKIDEYEKIDVQSSDPSETIDALFDAAIAGGKTKADTPEEDFTKQTKQMDKTFAALTKSYDLAAAREMEASSASPSSGYNNAELNALQQKVLELEKKQKKEDYMSSIYAFAGATDQDSIAKKRKEDLENAASKPLPVVSPVKHGQVTNVVSMLSGGNARTGFYGFGSNEKVEKNTIKATTYGKQVVESGQNVRVRLSEPMSVGSLVIRSGSILTGVATVGVDRLLITFTSVETSGVLSRVEIEAYDKDGQRGLFMPGSMEMDAIRELGAELATSISQTASQNVSIIGTSTSAAEEIKKDLGQGLIQGVGRFAAKKLQKIRVTIQDGHNLLLVPTER